MIDSFCSPQRLICYCFAQSVAEKASRRLATKNKCTRVVRKLITILSKGLNVIQNNLHSHQVLYIWGLGLNYLTASFNGYDPVAFIRLTPHYLGARPITLTFIARSP